MKKSRFILFVVLILVFSMMMAGCGGTGKTNSTNNNQGNKKSAEDNKNTGDSEDKGKTYTMKISAVISAKDWRSQALKDFKKVVEKKSNGQIKVELYFGGVLGSDSEVLQKVQMNNIQGSLTSTSNLSKAISKLKVLDLPYVVTKAEQYKAFYKDGKFAGKLTEVLQKQAHEKGLQILYLYPFQPREIGVPGKFIKTVDDIKGMKIRTSASDVERSIISSFGANPITLAVSQVYTALQTGTLDGEGLPITDMYAFKHYEVAKKISFVRYQSMAAIVFISKRFYDSLPSDLQKVVTDAAGKVGMNSLNNKADAVEKAKKAMKESGVEFYHNSPEELKTFKEASKSVIDKYKKEIGADWVNTVIDELNKYK